MRKIRVVSSYSGKIKTAEFENCAPFFSAELTYELPDTVDAEKEMEATQVKLFDICKRNFEAEADKANVQRIKNIRKDFHWGKLPNGKMVPSVTSILNYDTDFNMPDEELKQYASQGNLIDTQVKHFIKTGEWKNASEIEGTASDIYILKTGTLNLELEGWDFPGFLKKYPVKDLKVGETSFNEKWEYCGTPDGIGIYDGVATMWDTKRTANPIKNFQQIAAYSQMKGYENIKRMMVIPLNAKTDQGFSKPHVSDAIDKYFELFIAKRKEFRRVFGA